MRRLNYGNNTKIINPANSNKTAVKGQLWMNAIELGEQNNNQQ